MYKRFILFGIVIFFAFIVFAIGAMVASNEILMTEIVTRRNNIEAKQTPILTLSPTPIIISTATPTSQKSMYIAPVVDSDLPVHCQIHPNCGGGTIPLKKSECDNSRCCYFLGKWMFLRNTTVCPSIPTSTPTPVTDTVRDYKLQQIQLIDNNIKALQQRVTHSYQSAATCFTNNSPLQNQLLCRDSFYQFAHQDERDIDNLL